MSKSIHELGADFGSAALPTYNADQIPEEYRYSPPPPPGTYELRLPANLRNLWDRLELKNDDDSIKAIRAVVIFQDDPLIVVAGPDPKLNGTALPSIRISNAERRRSKQGVTPEILISDMTYLLRALGSTNPTPPTNMGYVDELCKYGGKVFRSDLEWGGYCNPKKQVYVEATLPDGTTQLQPGVLEGGQEAPGCGERIYQSDWPRTADGKMADRAVCKCGASLRPNIQLRNFKPSKLG